MTLVYQGAVLWYCASDYELSTEDPKWPCLVTSVFGLESKDIY